MNEIDFYLQVFFKLVPYVIFSVVIWHLHLKDFIKKLNNRKQKEI
jgi:F0F1-type ATP synthase membrane subunit b/b'